jgi:signal transduction histidine kinase
VAATARGSPIDELNAHERDLIRLRWAAGLSLLLATLVGAYVLRLTIPVLGLLVLGAVVTLSNAGLGWASRSLPRVGKRAVLLGFSLLDWIVLLVLIHLTGGIDSPALPLVLVQVVLTSILIPGWATYAYAGMAFVGVGVIAISEAAGWLPHHSLLPGLDVGRYQNAQYLGGALGLLAFAIALTVLLVVPFLKDLGIRRRQIESLYQATFDVSSSLELPEVLSRLVRGATLAFGAKGASIMLLDRGGTRLSMTAAYGLSKRFQEDGDRDISGDEAEPGKVLEGIEIVDDVTLGAADGSATKYLDEGIRAFISVPLQGRHGPLGVLHIYGRRPRTFGRQDAEFGTVIARQGAAAIENAMAFGGLRDADALKSQFVRAVTHELRSPVAASQSLLRVVLKQLGGTLNEVQQDILARLSDRLDALQLLIDDLLDLAAGKVEGLEGRLTPVSVEAAVLAAIERLRIQAADKGLALTVNTLQRGMTVVGSEQGLGRIFINLIGNAIKYSKANGRVDVRMERRGEEAVVTVKDTGIGIPELDLPHLFEEFYRASNVKEMGIQGTGLGLAIVRDLVERYGGHLSLQSRVGEGTTVTVTLPLSGGPISGVQ